MARRRRRSYEKRKPVAVTSIWTSIIGIICFLVGLTLMFLSASGPDFGRLPGTIGFMTMLVAMITFFVGADAARESDRDLISRVIGVIVPAVSMTMLLLVYFMGILFG